LLQRNSKAQLEFRYKQYGSLKNPAIVIIPGLDGATSFFNDVIPELTAENFNVVVYFLPLKTLKMSVDDYTFDFITTDLQALLSELNVTDACILGESFGGIVAQYFTFSHRKSVNSLVLLSSLAKSQLPYDIEFKFKYLLPVVRFIGFFLPTFAQYLFAVVHAEDVIASSEPQYLRDFFVKEASFAHFESVMARIDIAHDVDIVEKAKTIETPTLIVYGEEDKFTKKDSLELHKLIKKSVLKSIARCGHLPHVSSPKIFTKIVTDFLSGL
jgi:pimeloyl-ACP methyl ester carboxylesterase